MLVMYSVSILVGVSKEFTLHYVLVLISISINNQARKKSKLEAKEARENPENF